MAEVEDVVQVKVELRVEVGKVSLTFCKAVSAPLCPSPQCAGRARAPAALAPMLGVQPRRLSAQSTGTASAPPTGPGARSAAPASITVEEV